MKQKHMPPQHECKFANFEGGRFGKEFYCLKSRSEFCNMRLEVGGDKAICLDKPKPKESLNDKRLHYPKIEQGD